MKIHPPLIELLGGRWRFDVPVAAAAWSHDGSVAAFGLADGTVALARASWEGGPEVTPRLAGGIEVRPPTVSSPPVSRVSVHNGATRTLVAQPGAGFLSGGDDGVMHIGRDGIVTRDSEFPERRVSVLAAGPAGWRACAAGREAIITGRSRHVLTLPSEVSTLAFDLPGHCLAVARQDGTNIWSGDGTPMRDLQFRGLPRTLVWSPDGAWLAVGLDAGGVHAWRLADNVDVALGGFSGAGRALSFSSDARLLATSGARRVLYWQLGPEYLAEPGECGLPSTRAPVRVVAFHPSRLLVAAGYESGAVLLCQPGTEDVLLARSAGGGAPLTLAWSPEGQRLVFATEGGEAGIMLLPDGLFRTNLAATCNGQDAQP